MRHRDLGRQVGEGRPAAVSHFSRSETDLPGLVINYRVASPLTLTL